MYMNQEVQDILSRVWPDYRIGAAVGHGSFGTVYEASRRDGVASSRAAIKVVRIPTDLNEVEVLRAEGLLANQTREYFRGIVHDYEKEIELMDALKEHPNIVYIEDYKIHEVPEETLWYILIRMPLLTPLRQHLELSGGMDEKELVRLGIDLCKALEACHQRKIIHRDIKPENIFIDSLGNYLLGDFGVARTLEQATHGLSRKGTPNYMAPELYKASVINEDFDLASRVDLYSLGLVLYYIGNGMKLPFYPLDRQIISAEERDKAFVRRISGEELPPPRCVSPGLQRIILKASACRPEDRYPSAKELRLALEKQLSQGTREKNPEPVSGNDTIDTGSPGKTGAGEDTLNALPAEAPAKKSRVLKLLALAAAIILLAIFIPKGIELIGRQRDGQQDIAQTGAPDQKDDPPGLLLSLPEEERMAHIWSLLQEQGYQWPTTKAELESVLDAFADLKDYLYVIEKPTVRVRFIDQETDTDLKAADLVICPLNGTTEIRASEIAGYLLNGNGTVQVTVDLSGKADQAEVDFYYARIPVPAVRVRYLEQETGMELRAADTVTCPLNETTVISAPAVPGYSLIGEGSIPVAVNALGDADRTEVDFLYGAIPAPIVPVRYLEQESGTELRASDTVTCPLNETTEITAPTIHGYVLIGDAAANVAVDAYGTASRTEVEFLYSPIPAPTVLVRYIEQETGAELRASDTVTCPLNETTEITAPKISGYTLRGDAAANVIVDADGTPGRSEVEFLYSAIPAPNVPVRYLEQESGAELRASDTVTCPLNETTVITAPSIPGYALLGDAAVSVAVDADGIPGRTEVDFLYSPIPAPAVRVRYIDPETGAELRTSDTVTCPLNETTGITAPEIPGYRLLSRDNPVSVTVDASGTPDPAEVSFFYSAIPAPAVRVQYLDRETGAALRTADTVTCPLGETTGITAPEIDGYAINGEDSVNVSVDVRGDASPAEVSFYYSPIPAPGVLVRYLDAESARELRAADIVTCPLNETTVITAPVISGYAVNGDDSASVSVDARGNASPAEVSFYYSPLSAPTVQVRYLETDTDKELLEGKSVTCPLNRMTEVFAPVIAGYILNGDGTVYVFVDAEGSASPASVDFHYTPITAPEVRVLYLDENGAAELLPSETVSCPLNQTTAVRAPEISGYRLNGDSTVLVTVDAEGNADRTEAVFYYTAIPAPIVQVLYLDVSGIYQLRQTDSVCCPLNETTVIRAPDIPGHRLQGDGTARVTVDAEGNTEPPMVIFYYSMIPAPKVRVLFLDAGTGSELLPIQEVPCALNRTTSIPAEEIPGYALTGEDTVPVTVDAEGNADRAEVVFLYAPIPTPTPEPTATPTPSPTPSPTASPTPVPTPEPLPGDLNHDGVLDLHDYLLLQDYLSGETGDLTEERCDLDGDGMVGIRDLTFMLELIEEAD